MIMTNYVVPTTNTPLPTNEQILSAIKKRYDLDPQQKELVFELDGFEVVLNNKNDYLEIVTVLDGLKNKAGIDYIIEDTYTDKNGRTHSYTLYGSRLCKIRITDQKRFEAIIETHQKIADTPLLKNESEIIDYKGILYNLKSCELRYKNGQPTTVSPENREMKFFLYLHSNRGGACSFKNIAREVQTAGYKAMTSPDDDGVATTHEELLDRDFTEEVSGLKRDFRTLMLSLGMPEKEFKKIIVRVPKVGFKLT